MTKLSLFKRVISGNLHLYLTNLPALDVTNLFDIINNLPRLLLVHLDNLTKLEEIPTEAFKVLDK